MLGSCGVARAQGGPPFLTNDPGTPGNANWEINVATMPTVTRAAVSDQIPELDFNFGLGDRIQLTYEVPYVIGAPGAPARGAWGNGYAGIKWRFLDLGEDGWQIATFPQVELPGSHASRVAGIAGPAPRDLLPLEVARKLGPLDLDFEVGYYFRGRGPRERIVGLVVGHEVSPRLELDLELYDDRALGAPPGAVTVDVGGRYRLSPAFIALVMAGRSLNGIASGQPEFTGYLGIQILLSDYGRRLATARP